MKNTVTIIRKNSRPEVKYVQAAAFDLSKYSSHFVAIRKISSTVSNL